MKIEKTQTEITVTITLSESEALALRQALLSVTPYSRSYEIGQREVREFEASLGQVIGPV